jgi:O-antigen ligase
MQPSQPVLSKTGVANADGSAKWAAIYLSLLVILASFLGGATQRWSEAIVIGFFAILLLVRPPRHSPGILLSAVAFLFVALALVAFLPADWFALPQWRAALTKDLGVPLGGMISAQPWMTLDSLVLLLAGLAWILYVTTFDAPLRAIRLAARFYAAGIIALGAFSIYLHLYHQALPFWHNKLGFGPFPNRNQTGDLFGISTIVVLGCLQDDFRRGHKRWIFWLAGVFVLIAALVFAFSRAGILILVAGSTAWLVRLAFRKWSGPGLAIAASLLLLLIAGLLLFGGETIARFHLRLGDEGPVTSDFRWLVFRDALTMIQASPWYGVGLGNFESIFALFRDASRGVTRSHHPESDWLWMAAEMGWPAVVLVLVSFAVFVRRAFPLKEGTNQRLRYAALVGAFLFALHGFVDVSGHRFASFLAGTFLLGLAQARPVTCKWSRWSPLVFRVLGLLLLLVSIAWWVGWRQMRSLPGRVGVENARHAIVVANRGHHFADAITLANAGLRWAPLDWQLYYLRALARIGERQPVTNAIADFRRARFLEPSAYQLPFAEGKAWLGWQPALAITAWREALQREGANEAGIYALMLKDAADYDSSVLKALSDFAIGRPKITIEFLEAADPAQFQSMLHETLARDPSLSQFSFSQKRRVFAVWSRQNPMDNLLRAVQAHPEWREFAWPGLARYEAENGRFAAAWQLVRRYAPAPALPEISDGDLLPDLVQRFSVNPDDYDVGFRLYHAQIVAGKTDDALDTVRHFTARPGSPAYFNFLEAEAWAGKQNWERAWQSWNAYDGMRER